MLVSASFDTRVRLWAIDKANSTGEFKRELTGHQGWVRSVVFSSDGTILALASDDRTVRLWAIDKANSTGEFKRELTGHQGWVRSVAFSSDGTML
ncbi:WD40 repeat-like protein, partial [Hyaloscypha hepaticicola]